MGASITVTGGGPDIADGTYPMQLVAFEGPRTFRPENGPNAGQDVTVFDWTFRTESGVDLPESSSTNTGPRSKAYAWLTALLGTPPTVGMTIGADQLVGRWAYGQVRRDPPETGWPKIVGLMPMPANALQQQFGQATGAPTAAAPAQQPAPPADQAGLFTAPAGGFAASPVATRDPAGDLPF